MKKTRFETGMENLKKIDGKSGEAVIQSLEAVSPDLGKYIVEFAFGDIYERHGLSLQEKEMITLASLLTAGGCGPQLEVHINGALNVGIPPEKNHRNISAVHSLHGISQSVECRICGKEGYIKHDLHKFAGAY